MFNCSCCGADVTSPYFYNNGVYGYTCIKKIKPSIKRNKPKCKAVEVEVLNTNIPNDSSRGLAKILINGEEQIVPACKEWNNEMTGFTGHIFIGNYDYYDGKYWALV